MDEPFAALDEITRQRLNRDVLSWWQERRMAALFVTHSVYEAVFLSQRVLVMGARPGRITASIEIAEPYPRTPAFRSSPSYARYCEALSAAHVYRDALRDRACGGAPLASLLLAPQTNPASTSP
jgi:NitT/TauT family transport system ATP-binding protein